jgi:hypothetical protein
MESGQRSQTSAAGEATVSQAETGLSSNARLISQEPLQSYRGLRLDSERRRNTGAVQCSSSGLPL